MNFKKNMRGRIFLPLFLFVLFFSCSLAVQAEEHPAFLPESGLPLLEDYTTETQGFSLNKSGVLPARYDSRDYGYVTPVKDQNPWGACWAFGAMSTGETSLIKKGLAEPNIDLSEMHLAYFFFRCIKDPLGLTKGDTIANHTGEHYLDTGGNNLFTMFALSKWTGAAEEALVPYGGFISYVNEAYAYRDVAHLQNARFVNTKDQASVKDLILNYGSVSTSMYYNPAFLNANGAYLVPYTVLGTNHIITIVGWDDQYSRDNFSVVYEGNIVKPSKDGAWIAKNSHGTSIGDQGYLYISYEDSSVSKAGGDFLSYAFDMEKADNYDHNYQYDGGYSSDYLSLDKNISIANTYKLQANASGNEKLEAVSFSLLTQNVNYSIQIYKNPPAEDPSGGSPVLNNPVVGKTTYSGYYTIPLPVPPVFEQGDSFAVVIELSAAFDSNCSFFTDYSNTVSGLKFTSVSANNLSFCKTSKDSGWVDLNILHAGRTARIKAFTTDTTEPATKVDIISKALKKPVIKRVSCTSYNRTRLKWAVVKNAGKYEIYRSTNPDKGFKKIGSTVKTAYVDTKRVCGTKYYYKIRACRTANKKTVYSSYSAVKAVTVRPSGSAFISLKTASGSKAIKMKWKKVNGASGYEIYRSARKNGKYQKTNTITRGTKTTTSVKVPKKRTYYFKLRAYRVENGKMIYGAFSAPKKVQIH